MTRLRWVAFGVFTLASALNYLDRQVLAALAPTIRGEFGLSNADYGTLLAAFSLVYAFTSPLAGLFIDRVGLNRGASILVALWSLAGIGTGMAGTFTALLMLRAALGVTESGAIPASGKAIALYLPPQERALGTAVNQVGLSIGAAGAPLIAAWLAIRYGWRSAFFLTGALGFLWVPLWLYTARRIRPARPASAQASLSAGGMLRDRRLWALIAANVLSMTLYSLWTNWTTLFLVEEWGLPEVAANSRFAWIPPVFANLGGFLGGWLAWRAIRGGGDVEATRIRIARWAGWLLLATALIPFAPTVGLATAGVCWSFFWITAQSVNIYALPLDIFGANRAAFAVSALTFAFGIMQAFVSPVIGDLVDHYGFEPVCIAGAALPLAAAWLLRFTREST